MRVGRAVSGFESQVRTTARSTSNRSFPARPRLTGPPPLMLIRAYTLMTPLDRAAVEVREECIASQLRMASRAITQRYDDAIGESGIRSTQFTLLVALAQAPFVPLSKIAAVLAMDRTTMTRNLTPLIREGLVQEGPTEDRRVRAYALTAAGKKALERAIPAWRRAQAEMKKVLSADDRAHLKRILETTVRHAKQI